MTDLLHVLPELDLASYSHILPSLERARVTSGDLLTLDAIDVAKRAQVPLAEIRRLTDDVLTRLSLQNQTSHHDLDTSTGSWSTISTLDEGLDAALQGGFPAGRVTEITGESAAGKTQLLLSLCLAVQLPFPHGLSKSALYITTEAPLQTTRLSQILKHNPLIGAYGANVIPTLSRIHSAKVSDLEAQDHILRYQVPVAIERNNVGLIIMDSVAANFRAEFDRGNGNGSNMRKGAEAFAERSRQLIQLGSHLRYLAHKHNVAIVVANQVLDRFTNAANAFDYASQSLSQARSHLTDEANSRPVSAQGLRGRNGKTPETDEQMHKRDTTSMLPISDPMVLDHQQRFFTGWGDQPPTFPFAYSYHATNLKTPSLGLTWTNQLSARLVLLKEPIYKPQDYLLGPGSDIAGWHRTLKVAFSEWCADSNGEDGTRIEIWGGGVRAVEKQAAEDAQDDQDPTMQESHGIK